MLQEDAHTGFVLCAYTFASKRSTEAGGWLGILRNCLCSLNVIQLIMDEKKSLRKKKKKKKEENNKNNKNLQCAFHFQS